MSKNSISKYVFLSIILWAPCMLYAQEEDLHIYEKAQKQIQICNEARNNIGDEKKYVVLSGLQDVGDNDCQISLMFRSIEDMEKFKEARVSKGLHPEIITYKGRDIKLLMSIGGVVEH